MKHLNIDDIIQKRRQSKTVLPKSPQEQQHEFSRCVGKQLRDVNDQTIDHLIKIAIRKLPLNCDNRLDLLQLLGAKTGFHLNKHSMAQQLSLAYYQNVVQLSNSWQKPKANYFILKGELRIYEMKPSEIGQPKFNTQPQFKMRKDSILDDTEVTYKSLQEFEINHEQYIKIEELAQFRTAGPLLSPEIIKEGEERKESRKRILIAINAVVMIFPDLSETESDYDTTFNDGIASNDKLQILNYFPVLKVIGKRLNSFINNFKVKQFSLKQQIYKQGEKPKSVYFIIRGQISFELILEEEQNKKDMLSTKCQPSTVIHTEVVTESSYFGEEEIVFKTQRTQSAKVISPKCIVLELDRDKFQNDLIIRAAKAKRQARQRKLKKAQQILGKHAQKSNKQVDTSFNQNDLKQISKMGKIDKVQNRKSFSTRKRDLSKLKVMHNVLIRDCPVDRQEIEFSMLGVNPDMYDAVKKKYRKYSVKPIVYEPRSSWNFKKVWRILNLEDVLRGEQVEISGADGRKYFDCDKRLRHQMNETKSIRPKTTSSNYRTKLQYIAYLQQFNQ